LAGGADAPITTRSARSGLAQDRRAHVGGLAQDRLRACGDVLAGERGERVLRLGAHRLGDAGRHDVHDRHCRVVALGERVGEPERQLRVGTAADGDQDPPDVARAALLDHRDVARRLADDLVDGRRDDGRVRVPVGSRLAAPAEDHQVGFLFGRRLDDPRGRMASDPHQRVDHGPLGHVVEHLLQQPARLPGARRPL
jgi:hypothetical protein